MSTLKKELLRKSQEESQPQIELNSQEKENEKEHQKRSNMRARVIIDRPDVLIIRWKPANRKSMKRLSKKEY